MTDDHAVIVQYHPVIFEYHGVIVQYHGVIFEYHGVILTRRPIQAVGPAVLRPPLADAAPRAAAYAPSPRSAARPSELAPTCSNLL
jgi:hypothetical protein